jgi:hypothetical protein
MVVTVLQGYTLYFLSMKKLQTFLSEDCFREAYQKRLIKSDSKDKRGEEVVGDKLILASARNLVHVLN